jgi:hypothetical protein
MVSDSTDSNWIFAHRGQWSNPAEQNSVISTNTAFTNGFSVEADIRFQNGILILSHDHPSPKDVLSELNFSDKKRFALNIKEDGLLRHFENYRDEIIASSSFLFDGSLPEMYQFRKVGLPHALRLSEYEREISWKSEYLWIDGFETNWWIQDSRILALIENHQCIFVSPELHGREHSEAFDWFAELRVNSKLNFSVCTDYPQTLKELCCG